MKKLKIDNLPDADTLTDEEKKELLGGATGALNLNLTSGPDLAGERLGARKLRDLRDRDSKLRKRETGFRKSYSSDY